MPGNELIGKEEENQVKEVFDNGGVLFRQGFETIRNDCYKVKKFEDLFAEKMGIPYALAVTSGTAALRVALASLGLGIGDGIITQSFTFVATVEAIIESGATPICTEIDNTLNMDPNDLETKITSKTKAVIAVHMLGTPARLLQIKSICEKYKLFLIEDTAWGCGGSLNGKSLGTIGDVGTYSFDFAKTITTGEGGMIVFKNKKFFEKAKAWHDHGHENNPKLPRWEDSRSSSGFNYRMMELQGAVGIAQLNKLSKIVESQRNNFKKLKDALSDIKEISFRESPDTSYETADALIFFVKSKELAIKCRESLLNIGFSTKILPEAYSWHFAGSWTHMETLSKSHSNKLKNAFKISEKIISKAVSLPITVKEINDDKIKSIRNAISEAI